MARSDMSDLEWDFIKAVLPNKTRGKKRVDDRRVINGIFYVMRTGIPWADLSVQARGEDGGRSNCRTVHYDPATYDPTAAAA
ncbi:transposase, partial [Rhodobacteraceae bacterium MBR-64]